MNTPEVQNQEAPEKKRLGCLSILGLMLITVIVSVAVTVWFLNFYLFPKRFDPVELSSKETQVLEQKLTHFEGFGSGNKALTLNNDQSGQTLEPLAYSEKGADRTLALSERELNAILAKNTDLADKLAIDLSDELISARLRIPMDPDFPFFGGKLLKARAGVGVSFAQQRAVVVLKGVSVMGVPIPNAWLGGLKNIDLVKEFGQNEGFWKSFSDGIENIEVVDGQLQIQLKE
jgi:hypothetical protein